MRVTMSTLLVLAVFSTPAFATTHFVKPDGTGDFPTIQMAVSAASDFDTILLTDGTFTGDGNRDITNEGKSLYVISESGDPELCVIDCEGWYDDRHRGFHLTAAPGMRPSDWGIEGIKITRGWEHLGGAVLVADGIGPVFYNCIFDDNVGRDGGGAVYCDSGNPIFVSCTFHSNGTGEACGGAIYFGPLCMTEIRGCTFLMNASISGGAVYHEEAALGTTITRCTFYGGLAGAGSCMYFGGYSFASISNSIMYSHWKSPPVYCTDISTVMLSCCDIWGNEYGDWAGCIANQYGINGNISEDPMFCKEYYGDFSINQNSPCAPGTEPNPGCDLIGAWGIGCGGTAVEETTWGAVKARYWNDMGD